MESVGFALCVIFIELGLCWAFAMFVDYTRESIGMVDDYHLEFGETHPRKYLSSNIYYYMFQDTHVTFVIGFGFLVIFIRRYGNSSALMNLLIAAITLQWATLCQGFFYMDNGKIRISIANFLNADYASAAAFISFGAVIDLATPLQLIAMAICEIVFYASNEYIGLEIFMISDVGASMLVHVFGAYFGLVVSFVLRRTNNGVQEKNHVFCDSNSNFSVIGTIFLWLFWPSLNASLAQGNAQQRAIINTYYSLAASTVLTCALSSYLNKQQFNTIHIHKSILAGGVAIGTAADMMIYPFGAMVVGSAAGIVSILGTIYLTPIIGRKFGMRDVCGIHNLHGLPGLIAAFTGAVTASLASEKEYAYSLYRLFPAMIPINGSPEYWNIKYHVVAINPGPGRSALMQGAYQLVGLATTLAFACIGGLFTGLLLRLPVFKKAGRNLQHGPI